MDIRIEVGHFCIFPSENIYIFLYEVDIILFFGLYAFAYECGMEFIFSVQIYF